MNDEETQLVESRYTTDESRKKYIRTLAYKCACYLLEKRQFTTEEIAVLSIVLREFKNE